MVDWPAITFEVLLFICFPCHFRIKLLDDVSGNDGTAITQIQSV